MRPIIFIAVLTMLLSTVPSRAAGPEMLIQVGMCGPQEALLDRPVAAMDVLWPTSHNTGLWCEFATMERPNDDYRFAIRSRGRILASGEPGDEFATQILGGSAGFLLGSAGSALFPYLRAGLGVYRDQEYGAAYFDRPEESWGLGMSFGLGIRVDPARSRVSPHAEARYHLTRFNGNDRGGLFALSAGLWFR